MEDITKTKPITTRQIRDYKFKKLLKEYGIESIELEEHLNTKKVNFIYVEKERKYYPKFKIESYTGECGFIQLINKL